MNKKGVFCDFFRIFPHFRKFKKRKKEWKFFYYLLCFLWNLKPWKNYPSEIENGSFCFSRGPFVTSTGFQSWAWAFNFWIWNFQLLKIISIKKHITKPKSLEIKILFIEIWDFLNNLIFINLRLLLINIFKKNPKNGTKQFKSKSCDWI